MAVQNLKSQIARLPEQPGVYLFSNETGETIYIGKARSLRDRVRSYLGARGLHPKTDALLDEAASLEVIITDSVVGGSGTGEQPRQRAIAEVQRPASRRQELSLSATDDQRSISARARRQKCRARRHVLCRAIHAGVARTPDDGADAPVVRHSLVQRGHHRQPRAAMPRIRHPALFGALCGGDLFSGAIRRGRSAHATVFRRQERGARGTAHRFDAGGRVGRTVRRSGASARCRANHSDVSRSAAEDCDCPHGRSRCVRPAHGTGRGDRARLRDARRPRARARRVGRERGHFGLGGRNP